MFQSKSNGAILSGVLIAVTLWAGNNVGSKYLVAEWPPMWVLCTRFYCCSLLLVAILRYTRWFGEPKAITTDLSRYLWWEGSLSFSLYILCYIWALRYTAASYVALYFAASPVWAILWEFRSLSRTELTRRGSGAVLTLVGVGVLFWPALKGGQTAWFGNILGLLAGLLWTNYSQTCSRISGRLPGAQMTAQTFWRCAVWLTPFALWDQFTKTIEWRWDLILAQGYSIIGPGSIAFVFWMNALKHWPVSRLMLFVNLAPLITVFIAKLVLNETISASFWPAMILVLGGVAYGQGQPRKTRRDGE